MGQTVVEKIAQAHMSEGPSGRALRAGDFLAVRPHHVMTHDNTAPVIKKFGAIGAPRVSDPGQPVFILDHDIQNTSESNLAKYRDIEAFAREIDQAQWANLFREARDALDTGAASPWIESLFGDGLLGKEAFGLLAASYKADVFGGMGSWNDIPTDETIEPRYRELSDALSGLLVPCFVTAVNSRTATRS